MCVQAIIITLPMMPKMRPMTQAADCHIQLFVSNNHHGHCEPLDCSVGPRLLSYNRLDCVTLRGATSVSNTPHTTLRSRRHHATRMPFMRVEGGCDHSLTVTISDRFADVSVVPCLRQHAASRICAGAYLQSSTKAEAGHERVTRVATSAIL